MSGVNKLLRVNTCFMLQAGAGAALMGLGVRTLHDVAAWAGLVTPTGKGRMQPECFRSPPKFLQGFRHVFSG